MRFRFDRRALVKGGLDPAATGMTHDDKTLDPQIHNRELDARADAVIFAARFKRRHEVGDIARHEQFARHRIENRFRIDTAIAARNNHDLGVLAVGGQLFILVGIGNKDAMLEAPVAVRQGFGEKRHVKLLIWIAAFEIKSNTRPAPTKSIPLKRRCAGGLQNWGRARPACR